MKKPYLNALATKTEPLIKSFGGVNTALDALSADSSHSPQMQNVSASSNGALSPREGRTNTAAADGEILFLGVLEGQFITCVVKKNGVCRWQYFGGGAWVTICTVDESPTGRYDLVKFIDKSVLVTGKVYTVGGVDKTKCYFAEYDGSSFTASNETNMPASDMLETVNGRLCAASTKTDKVYLGGIMDASVWFDISDGVEQNVITQNGETGEGMATFGDHIVYLKPHSVSELYGNTPDTYRMITVSESIGCVAGKTLCSEKSLLWLSGKGVCSYSGGAVPKIISQGIEKYIQNIDTDRQKEACAGSDGKRYIISLPQTGGGKINCVLNLDTLEWFVEDNADFTGFARMGDTLYGATADGKIYALWDKSSTETVEWSWRSKTFRIAPSEKESVRRISVIADVDGEMCVACVNSDGGRAEKTVSSAGRIFSTIRLHPSFFHSRDSFYIEISGKGKCKVHTVSAKMRSIKGEA